MGGGKIKFVIHSFTSYIYKTNHKFSCQFKDNQEERSFRERFGNYW